MVAHPPWSKTFDYGQSTKGEHFSRWNSIEGVSLKFVQAVALDESGDKLELLARGRREAGRGLSIMAISTMTSARRTSWSTATNG